MKNPLGSLTSSGIVIISLIGVLVLWLVLGMGGSFFFKDGLKESGLFGDTFGSVNALFSGFGFVALTYTIWLQIKTNEAQRNQDKFKFLYEYFTEIKADANEFTYGSLKGSEAVRALFSHIRDFPYEVVRFPNHIRYLEHIVMHTLHYNEIVMENRKFIDPHGLSSLRTRVMIFYLNYFEGLEHIKLKTPDKPFDDLVKSCDELYKSIKDLTQH